MLLEPARVEEGGDPLIEAELAPTVCQRDARDDPCRPVDGSQYGLRRTFAVRLGLASGEVALGGAQRLTSTSTSVLLVRAFGFDPAGHPTLGVGVFQVFPLQPGAAEITAVLNDRRHAWPMTVE